MMRATIAVLIAISTLVIAEAYPTLCEAKGKKAKSKADAAIPDDPYKGEDQAAVKDEAAAKEPGSDAEAAASALDGAGEGATGKKPGSLLQQDGETAGGESGTVRRSNRMEFDERLVKGQAAKSGAVYLFERAPRRLPGLVPMRRSYRKRIVEPVLGERELKPAVYSQKPPGAPVVAPEIEKPPEEKQPEAEPAQAPGETDKVDKVKDKPKK
jgi:hypothetical protein